MLRNNEELFSQTLKRQKVDVTEEIVTKEVDINSPTIIGYMPKRDDFDIEYDNDLEEMLADLEFTGDEHANELELKY